MRVVLQRVSQAEVAVDGRVVASVGPGLALLVGFRDGDGASEVDWMAEKIMGLRIFPDEEGKMNLDLAACRGDVLVVSQFTLYGDTRKGRRPSFVEAAPPETAIPLYEHFVGALRDRAPCAVATGEFGAHMAVSLTNDGPVTLVLER